MAVSKPRKHLFTPDKTAVAVSGIAFLPEESNPFQFQGLQQQRPVEYKASPARFGLPFLQHQSVIGNHSAATPTAHTFSFTSPSCSMPRSSGF